MANETNLTQEQFIYQENTLKYENFKNLMDRIKNPTLIACGALGMLSSILTLVTICSKDLFKEPCFI